MAVGLRLRGVEAGSRVASDGPGQRGGVIGYVPGGRAGANGWRPHPLLAPLDFARRPDGSARRDLSCTQPGVDPETFFPMGALGTGAETRAAYQVRVADAKSLCDPCPVRQGCLQWALDHLPQGIWGGTTEGERHELTGRWPANRTGGTHD
jgi:hypothetical protein